LEILNVQGGDVKITFDKGDIGDTLRAKRIITDMLRRGYAIIVEVEREGVKAYERIVAFDETKGEYLIADFDPMAAHQSDMDETAERLKRLSEQHEAELALPEPSAPTENAKRGRPKKYKKLPMESTKATAIGRTAGGD